MTKRVAWKPHRLRRPRLYPDDPNRPIRNRLPAALEDRRQQRLKRLDKQLDVMMRDAKRTCIPHYVMPANPERNDWVAKKQFGYRRSALWCAYTTRCARPPGRLVDLRS
jgi:hypothetical protein